LHCIRQSFDFDADLVLAQSYLMDDSLERWLAVKQRSTKRRKIKDSIWVTSVPRKLFCVQS